MEEKRSLISEEKQKFYWWVSGIGNRLPRESTSLIFDDHSSRYKIFIKLFERIQNKFGDVIAIQMVVTYKMAFPTYAWAYFPVNKNASSKTDFKSSVQEFWVNYGGSSMSSGGEYRQSLIKPKFHDNPKWKSIYSRAYDYFLYQMQEGVLGFFQHLHFPDNFSDDEKFQFKQYLEKYYSDLAIEMFVYSWLHGYFEIEENVAPSNLSWDYRFVMHHPAHRPFYESILEETASPLYVPVPDYLLVGGAPQDKKKYKKIRAEKIGKDYVFGDDPRTYILQILLDRNFTDRRNLHWGHKMIPVTQAELSNKYNIMYPLWKADFIEKIINDRILNMKMTGLLYAGGFLLNGGEETFDSVAIRDKYVYDETGLHMAEHAVREGLTVNITDDPYQIAAAFADSAGRGAYLYSGPREISNKVLVRIYEHAFATLPDAIARSMDGCVPELLKHLTTLDGFPIVRVLFFEYIWSIYSAAHGRIAHSRINVDHLAIRKIVYPLTLVYHLKMKPNLVVVRATASKIYMFPRIGYQGVIIGWGSGGFIFDLAEIAQNFSEWKPDSDSDKKMQNAELAFLLDPEKYPRTSAFVAAEKRRALQRLDKKFHSVGVPLNLEKKNLNIDAIVELLALADIHELGENFAGYYAAASNEYGFTSPPGCIDFFKRVSASALEHLKKTAIVPANAGGMKIIESILEEFYSSDVSDGQCMLDPDRLKACLVSEFNYIDSNLDFDSRRKSREEIKAQIEHFIPPGKRFLDKNI